jgi:hypothetical protein
MKKLGECYNFFMDFVSCENECLDLILEGYGVVEFENMECNVLECISEYRTQIFTGELTTLQINTDCFLQI